MLLPDAKAVEPVGIHKYTNSYNSGVLDDMLRRETFRVLFGRTHFKRAQLDALLVRRYALENHMKLKEGLSMRDKKTSMGSMERSAFQAEEVISGSVATLILGLGLGLVSTSAIESIPKVARVLEQSSIHELSDDELTRFLELINAVLHTASHK